MTDLGFINTPVVIVATVVDNKMETDVLDVIDGNIRFNVDLVWETNKTNIKKMRNSNVSIKINLFKYFNENRREKFGYVVMSLRTAQYAPRGKTVKINDTSIKILGLGKEAKGFSPHLLLSLRYCITTVTCSVGHLWSHMFRTMRCMEKAFYSHTTVFLLIVK